MCVLTDALIVSEWKGAGLQNNGSQVVEGLLIGQRQQNLTAGCSCVIGTRQKREVDLNQRVERERERKREGEREEVVSPSRLPH